MALGVIHGFRARKGWSSRISAMQFFRDIFRRYDDKIAPVDIRIKRHLLDCCRARHCCAPSRTVEDCPRGKAGHNRASRSRDFIPVPSPRHRAPTM